MGMIQWAVKNKSDVEQKEGGAVVCQQAEEPVLATGCRAGLRDTHHTTSQQTSRGRVAAVEALRVLRSAKYGMRQRLLSEDSGGGGAET